MGTIRTLARGVVAAAVICSLCFVAPSPAEAAKKKAKKAPSSVAITKAVNAPVPQDVAGAQSIPVRSTIEIGKGFKGRVVGDLDVTRITTTGSGANAADDLVLKLTGPNGRTVRLTDGRGDVSLGPWTLDDETRTSICDFPTPTCPDPDADLTLPFAGTSNLLGTSGGAGGPLSVFDGLPMRGKWTLTVYDDSGATTTNTFVSWGLKVTAAKPTAALATAKKKGKSPGVFQKTNATALALPNFVLPNTTTPVTSTITVPKSFAGRVVGDVNVTGIRTTGTGVQAAEDIVAYLIAPNGRLIELFEGVDGVSFGGWTLDDDTQTAICDNPTPTCPDPDSDLIVPFAGTSHLPFDSTGDTGPLSKLNGVPMAGTWKLLIADADTGGTSVLNSWGLRITPAKPIAAPKPAGKKAAGAAAKGKKGKKKTSVSVTKPVGQAVPNNTAGTQSVPVISTIKVNDKAFKGKTVGDLNVTGISTSGSNTSAANDLIGKLTGPNGRTTRLFISKGDVSLGPWTLDDDTPVSACDNALPSDCGPPFDISGPFAGTTNLLFTGETETGPLSVFNGSPINGTWTFTVADVSGPMTTSTFNSWGLKLTVAKPIAG